LRGKGCSKHYSPFLRTGADHKVFFNMKSLGQEMCEELLEVIRSRKEVCQSHRQWIEDCFQLSFRAYCQLQKMKEAHRFQDQHEQVWFYKTIEPQFGAQIKYFVLLYVAEMFVPEDDSKRMDYWNGELKKVLDFFEKHETFYLYCKKGMTYKDYIYFTSSSTHVDLLASLIAREKYMEYLHSQVGASVSAEDARP